MRSSSRSDCSRSFRSRTQTEAIGGGAVYNFAIPPGRNSAMVRFVLKPSTVGLVTAEVREVDGESLFRTQMVLP
jgi:hypothetical protein